MADKHRQKILDTPESPNRSKLREGAPADRQRALRKCARGWRSQPQRRGPGHHLAGLRAASGEQSGLDLNSHPFSVSGKADRDLKQAEEKVRSTCDFSTQPHAPSFVKVTEGRTGETALDVQSNGRSSRTRMSFQQTMVGVVGWPRPRQHSHSPVQTGGETGRPRNSSTVSTTEWTPAPHGRG